MSKVSVITSIYETPCDLLERALESLVNQTLDDIEYIWVNDGSSEKVTNCILKFINRQKNIKYIRFDNNAGFGNALNYALSLVTSDYIGFCDSDDWVDLDYYEKMYNKAVSTDADIVFAEYKQEAADSVKISRHRVFFDEVNEEDKKVRLLKNGAIWDKLYKTSMLQKNKLCFCKELKSYYLDVLFLAECFKSARKVVLLRECYYHYYVNITSTMRGKKGIPDRIRSRILAIEGILRIASNSKSQKAKEEYIKYLIRSAGLLDELKREEVFLYLCEAVRDDTYLIKELTNMYGAHNPSICEKILSLKNDKRKTYLWLLGIKIKLFRCKEK